MTLTHFYKGTQPVKTATSVYTSSKQANRRV